MDILIAKDEKDIAFMYTKLLEDTGHVITITYDGQECLDVYRDKSRKMGESANVNSHSQPFDVVILDHKLPRLGGFSV